MKLRDILLEKQYVRAYKKVGDEIKLQYRCVKGPKKGKVVANPETCTKRKSLKKMIAGQIINAKTKSKRAQKNLLTRRTKTSKQMRVRNRIIDPRLPNVFTSKIKKRKNRALA